MMFLKGIRLGFILLIVVVAAAMAPKGWCGRAMKGDDFKKLFEDKLPRGPVPPSGPSVCHNKLDPYRQSQFSFSQASAICP
ncbi:hypothetical protein NMG60_11018840 [Bertholletia excelsa]